MKWCDRKLRKSIRVCQLSRWAQLKTKSGALIEKPFSTILELTICVGRQLHRIDLAYRLLFLKKMLWIQRQEGSTFSFQNTSVGNFEEKLPQIVSQTYRLGGHLTCNSLFSMRMRTFYANLVPIEKLFLKISFEFVYITLLHMNHPFWMNYAQVWDAMSYKSGTLNQLWLSFFPGIFPFLTSSDHTIQRYVLKRINQIKQKNSDWRTEMPMPRYVWAKLKVVSEYLTPLSNNRSDV